MKYLFVIIALTLAIFLFKSQVRQTTGLPAKQDIVPTPSYISPDFEVSLGKQTFAIYWQEINASGLRLIPNFEEKLTASDIMESEQCSYGANGGFYTPDSKPIGLFIADGTKFSSAATNATLNGFFVRDQNVLLIQQNIPSQSADFALQSGPYMTPRTNLGIQRDEFARRVLVARSGNRWYFLTVTDIDNAFGGPLLADLPEILDRLPIDVDEALNLDGGSASAFYNGKGVRLGELTPIGSFFCGK